MFIGRGGNMIGGGDGDGSGGFKGLGADFDMVSKNSAYFL